eukprot:TRINITY_DN2697_c0_g1_i3.p1 TRINITY_DN2697_c0_g1~~TRINITY_DN2697_c0_g1_i3.p1  ORF type:complete len:332 (-),score=95.02 TRINITY_DN2697_c0_g1_i3:53-1048(-)
MAFAAFAAGVIFMGILLLLIGIINIMMYDVWKKRIPFASAVLSAVAAIIKTYPALNGIAIGMTVVQVFWCVVWGITVVAVSAKYDRIPFLAYIFLLLSFYWTAQVIKNVVHVTVSGTVASAYFLGNSAPENPSAKSFHRATTTSFGSICYGSLLVAIIQVIRAILRRFSEGNRRNPVAAILACIANCILGMFENMFRYFNHYAFVQVAIYGKAYMQAAKDTWALVQSRGIDAIINDNLIENVLSFGVFLCAATVAAVAAVWGSAALPTSPFFTVIILAFLIAWVIMIVSMEVVNSGVATLFVCYAEDPAALQASNPELFRLFVSTYPGTHR